MAKKEKIEIRRDENLSEIDAELDDALVKLEAANFRIGELLGSIEPKSENASPPSSTEQPETSETPSSSEEAG